MQNNTLTREHKVLSREEWTAARKELLKKEKESTRLNENHQPLHK
jgi:predicted dithiol-disulfide oxidoreductase (DUF899 family)